MTTVHNIADDVVRADWAARHEPDLHLLVRWAMMAIGAGVVLLFGGAGLGFLFGIIWIFSS